MPPRRKTTTRAAERRRQRRQRQVEGNTTEQTAPATRMAPLSLDPRRKAKVEPTVAPPRMDRSTEYMFVRRDLWRLTIYSIICFALMIAVLLFVNT